MIAEALVRSRGVDAALRAGPGHVGALVHVVAPGRVVRPREVAPVAAALEAHLPGVILLVNLFISLSILLIDYLPAALHADVGARVGVAAPVAVAASNAGALVREVAAVVEPVADALPGDAGAVLAAGWLFYDVVRCLLSALVNSWQKRCIR